MAEYIFNGTGTKWAVNIKIQDFSMDEDEWKIVVSRGPKEVVFTKENSIRDINGQWYICVLSEDLGPGQFYITFYAYVVDGDFPGGIRPEIRRFEMINNKPL